MSIQKYSNWVEVSLTDNPDDASLEVSEGQADKDTVDFEAYGPVYDSDTPRSYVYLRLPLEEVVALRDFLDAQILRLDKGAD